MKNSKGSILISVLIMITLCTTVALFIHEKAIKSYGSVITLQNEYQGAIYSMTAIKAIEAVFQYDDSKFDGQEDIWNLIPPIPVDKGFMSIFITPINMRFPLNALRHDNETVRERYEDALVKFTEKLEAEFDLDELKSWIGTGTIRRERIDENNAPYSFKAAALNSLVELTYLPSFNLSYRKFSEYVSIGEEGYKININLASEDLILAVLPELEPFITDILSAREDADFKDVSDIYKIMGENSQAEYTKILPYFDVKSSLFYVKLELNILDENRYYHVLFKRNGKSAKPIKYIEGGSLNYF